MEIVYIKSNITKHTAPKVFYPHQLKQSGKFDIFQIKSCDNLFDLFTKFLPTSIFHKLVHRIGMLHSEIYMSRGESHHKLTITMILHFPFISSMKISHNRFLKRQYANMYVCLYIYIMFSPKGIKNIFTLLISSP